MRIVHIADLHAGKTLNKVSRNEDLVYALEQVISFIRDSKADLLLIAGDVFDKPNPDNESKQLIFEFFLKLKDLQVPAVLIAGNHDSYDFMRSIKSISSLAGIHIFDRPSSSKSECVFEFNDLGIACLPYPSERKLTSTDEDATKTYAQKVSEFIKYLRQMLEGYKFKVLLAHLFLAGSKISNTEREATVTNYFAVPPESFPEGFDYVALGHVHRFQRIEALPYPAYYTGSMFQIDFSEEGQKKFFNFVELKEGSPPKVESVELDLKNPLKHFVLDQKDVLKEIPNMKLWHGYIKVSIKVEAPDKIALLVDKLRKEVGSKMLKVEQIRSKMDAVRKRIPSSVSDPLSLYKEFYKVRHGTNMPQEVERIFIDLLEEASSQS